MKVDRKKAEGFTVIEVTLVLALAGLIFLMAFIALPQLQRSQRDAERKDDMMMFTEAVKKYQTNNRGTLPSGMGSGDTTWDGFVRKYIDENYGTPSQEFQDPSGEGYRMKIENNQYSYTGGATIDYTIHVVVKGVCKDDYAIEGSNPREFAVVYKTESSGVYCFDSSS